ncbi:MAG: CREG family protein [Planctomycetota bacterium]|nr:CREG family protein [Planctomycetota bacterium]
MSNGIYQEIASMVQGQRWAALATLDEGAPLGSMVAYAPESGLTGLLLFLSGLAPHTRNLLADPRASLVISDPDPGHGDPQILRRVSLQGQVQVISRQAAEFPAAWQRYISAFPDSEPRLALSDFGLFRFVIEEVRYVGGFARAATVTGDQLREASSSIGA